MTRLFRNLFGRRYILFTLVQRELRIRYKDSALGMVWMFGAPLLMMATYSLFVMGFIRAPTSGTDNVLQQLAGLWLCLGFWQWLTESANRSVNTFHDNSQLVKRMPIPLGMLPIANVVVSAISFAVPLAVSIACMTVAGSNFKSVMISLLGIIGLLPWLLGLTLLVSVAGTYVKDAKHALPLILNVGMLLSPVLYSIDHAPSMLQAVIKFNPLAPGLSLARGIYDSSVYSLPTHAFSVIGSAIFVALAVHFFNRRKKDFYDVV